MRLVLRVNLRWKKEGKHADLGTHVRSIADCRSSPAAAFLSWQHCGRASHRKMPCNKGVNETETNKDIRSPGLTKTPTESAERYKAIIGHPTRRQRLQKYS